MIILIMERSENSWQSSAAECQFMPPRGNSWFSAKINSCAVGAVLIKMILSNTAEKSHPFGWLFFSGIGIRTPTYRVRVCCATFTQTRYLLQAHIIICTFWHLSRSFFNFFRFIMPITCWDSIFCLYICTRIRTIVFADIIWKCIPYLHPKVKLRQLHKQATGRVEEVLPWLCNITTRYTVKVRLYLSCLLLGQSKASLKNRIRWGLTSFML